jgi:hypothetical protein
MLLVLVSLADSWVVLQNHRSRAHDTESNHQRSHAVVLSNCRWRHCVYGGQSDECQARGISAGTSQCCGWRACGATMGFNFLRVWSRMLLAERSTWRGNIQISLISRDFKYSTALYFVVQRTIWTKTWWMSCSIGVWGPESLIHFTVYIQVQCCGSEFSKNELHLLFCRFCKASVVVLQLQWFCKVLYASCRLTVRWPRCPFLVSKVSLTYGHCLMLFLSLIFRSAVLTWFLFTR